MKSKTIKKLTIAGMVLSTSLFVFSTCTCISEYLNKQRESLGEENKFYRLLEWADKGMIKEFYKEFMKY